MKLTANWQFREVYGRGDKLVCDCAVIFYYRTPGESGGPRYGVVASRRVGSAVDRNRAKRVLREAARCLLGKLNHRDMWIVLVARSTIKGRSAAQVKDDVGRALESAGLVTTAES